MPKKDTSLTTTQILRDRLNKTKSSVAGTKSKSQTKASLTGRNQFTQTASGSTARKSRKGMRPG